jgi:Leucine-rich repeat (LRR) protein
MKTTGATEEQVTKIRELLTHEDPGHQQQGLELAKDLGDWSPVLAGCGIGEDGGVAVSFGELNSTILELMLTAPGFDASTVTTLDLSRCQSLQNVDGLTGLASLTALTSLVIYGCSSLTDLTGLSGLAALTSLELRDCTSLTDLSGLASLTALEHLTISGCRSLRDLGPLARLGELKSLDLSENPGIADLTPDRSEERVYFGAGGSLPRPAL